MKQNYPCMLFACALIFTSPIFAQKVISLSNPSFESDAPNINMTPPNWGSFSAEKDRFPDLLPGDYEINAFPQDGKTFVGLCSRPYDQYEGIGQSLSQQLEKDSVYTFSIWLAHASKYIVPSFKKGKQRGTKTCNGITTLRVLGVNSKSRLNEVLAETRPIEHDEWREYTLWLNPRNIDCDQIVFSTGNSTVIDPYFGNLLIDNCAEIKMLHWDEPNFTEPLNFSAITTPSRGTQTAASKEGEIPLKSPSFEQNINEYHPAPEFWDNLGGANQSPPDIQPGRYSVTKKPHHGRQYLGMVTRANGTREAVGQPLPQKMKLGAKYTFSAWLAMSSEYGAFVGSDNVEAMANPTLLRIWGLNSRTFEKELLVTSDLVDHEVWRQYTFSLEPTRSDLDYFVLEAWYDLSAKRPCNGNLLIDDCSAIILVKD